MAESATVPDHRPNLFVLGVARSGSSLTHQTLRSHPRIFMPMEKEPMSLMGPGGRYEGPQAPVPNVPLDEYEALFEEAGGEPWWGEGSVFYLSCEVAADRIAERYPDARFVLTFRDPLERALSQWRYNRLNDREPLDFLDALEAEDERLAEGWSPYYEYRRLSEYARLIEMWTDRFDPDQFCFLVYDQLKEDEDAFFEEIFSFLGLDPEGGYIPDQRVSSSSKRLLGSPRPLGGLFEGVVPRPILDLVSKLRYVSTSNDKLEVEDLPPDRVNQLREAFEEDIQAVERVTGRDLDGWRASQ